MIYLIGGPPRCGKTTLARQFAEQVQCSWFPVDYLSTVIEGYIPESELPSRYPSLDVPRNNDVRYAHYSAAQIIDNYRTKAHSTQPGLRWFIEYARSDRRAFVLEGYHIEPRYVRELHDALGEETVRAVFLYREDVTDIAASLRKGTDPEDWALRLTRDEATFPRIATMISRYGAWFRDEAARHHCVAFNMDHDFAYQLNQALHYLQREQ